MTNLNRQFRLAARPVGRFSESDFELVESRLAGPNDGQFLAKITHLSIDPAMRAWMDAGHATPVEVGDVMRAIAIGRVTKSRHAEFGEGDFVRGMFGVQEFVVSDGAQVSKINSEEGASLAAHLGVLGNPGMVAYFGLLDVGRLADDDVVLVSGAAGAVGSVVGKIAKIKGATAIGVAGGPEKCGMLVDELGFDGAVDYKRGNLSTELSENTPRGVDVFFDNVGGEILNQGLARLNHGARVVVCGAISRYDSEEAAGPSNYTQLLYKSASMIGAPASDFTQRFPEAIAQMSTWLAGGQLTSVEDTVAGDIEMFPTMLRRLFSGANRGKSVLELGR